jgi:hypothetical protein
MVTPYYLFYQLLIAKRFFFLSLIILEIQHIKKARLLQLKHLTSFTLNDGVEQTFGTFFLPVQFPLNCATDSAS